MKIAKPLGLVLYKSSYPLGQKVGDRVTKALIRQKYHEIYWDYRLNKPAYILTFWDKQEGDENLRQHNYVLPEPRLKDYRSELGFQGIAFDQRICFILDEVIDQLIESKRPYIKAMFNVDKDMSSKIGELIEGFIVMHGITVGDLDNNNLSND